MHDIHVLKKVMKNVKGKLNPMVWKKENRNNFVIPLLQAAQLSHVTTTSSKKNVQNHDDLSSTGSSLKKKSQELKHLFKAAEKEKDNSLILSLYQDCHRLSVKRDAHMYRVVNRVCRQQGDWKLGFDLLRQMEKDGYSLSIGMYINAIYSCAPSKNWQKAIGLLDEMVMKKMKLHPKCFYATMYVCEKSSKYQEVERLLHWMKKIELVPTVDIYNLVFQCYEKEKQWKKVISLFKVMQMEKTTLQPNVFSYSMVILACGKDNNYEKGLQFFHEAKTKKIPLNVVVYTSIISTCAHADQFNTCMGLFEDMKLSGILPNVMTYNAMIRACKKRPSLWEKAFQFFEEMRKQDILPDLKTFSSLISVYASTGKCDLIQETLKIMDDLGIVPNEYFYSSMITSFKKAGKYQEAIELFQKFQTLKNYSTDLILYNSIISACAVVGDWQKACFFLQELETHHLQPNVETYTNVICAYRKAKCYEQAIECFRNCKRKNIHLDTFLYNAMLGVYSDMGDCNAVVQLREEMVTNQIELNEITYLLLINTFANANDWKGLLQMVDHSQNDNVQLHYKANHKIISTLQRCGQSTLASTFRKTIQI